MSAGKCICILAQSQPPISHNHTLQWHLLACSITSSKCISEFSPFWPARVSHSYTQLLSPRASLNSLDYSNQLHLHVHMITAFRWISMLSQFQSSHSCMVMLWYHLQPGCSYIYILRVFDKYMPYRDTTNDGTVTNSNMRQEIGCSYTTESTTAITRQHQITSTAAQRFQLLSMSPTGLYSGLSWFQKSSANVGRGHSSSKIPLWGVSSLLASWSHLHIFRCCQEHLTMLLQSLRTICTTAGEPRSIWQYLGGLALFTGVSGRFACNFRTDLHFADIWNLAEALKSQSHSLSLLGICWY
jgi:hypothetical protein